MLEGRCAWSVQMTKHSALLLSLTSNSNRIIKNRLFLLFSSLDGRCGRYGIRYLHLRLNGSREGGGLRLFKLNPHFLVKQYVYASVARYIELQHFHHTHGLFVAAMTDAFQYTGGDDHPLMVNIVFQVNCAFYIGFKSILGIAQVGINELGQFFRSARIFGLVNKSGFFLVPLAPGIDDIEELREEYFDKIIERFEILTQQTVKSNIVFKQSFCKNDFVSEYNSYKGNAYGMANTLLQTAFLRPKLKNLKNIIPKKMQNTN